MKKPKLLEKRVVTQFQKRVPEWSVNEAKTICTGHFDFPNVVSGLMFVTRIVVITEVRQQPVTTTLSGKAVQVKIAGTKTAPLAKKDLELAEKISDLFLSTFKNVRRR